MDSIFLILTLLFMKKLLRFLVIFSSFVLPILIPSTVFAFGGPAPAYGFQDRERYRDMSGGRGQYDAEQTYLRRFELNRGHRFGRNDDQGSNSQGDQPNPPGAGQNAPLDGGLSLLLAAGIGLGMKKAFGKNKPAEENNNDTE